MKIVPFSFSLLLALPFAITANPIGQQQEAQKALARPNSLSPANSFSTTSDVESASSKSSKFSLSRVLKPAKTFSSFGGNGEFKCHSYPQNTLLSELSVYVTSLLRSSRDEILFNGNRANSGSLFKSCYAGYAADDVNPALYFGRLARKQANAIEKLLRNGVVGTWPGVIVVTSKDAVALVMDGSGNNRLSRRNTI